MVIAGLLMMMLTVTIIPARDSTALGEGRLLDNLEIKAGPGCYGPPFPLEEGGWKYVLSGEKPPVGFHTALALLYLTAEVPPDRPASLESVDLQTGSYRLLSGSVIGLHDDAGKPVASISTTRANTKTLYSMYDGSYFNDARTFKIDPGLYNYIADKPPSAYAGLQQPLFSEARWGDVEGLRFGGYSKYWLRDSLSLGRFGLYLAPGASGNGSQEPTADDEDWSMQVDSDFIKRALKWNWGGGMVSIDPPTLNLDENTDTRLAFEEDNATRKVQATDMVAPNDPLFSKKQSEAAKTVSTVKKGLGSLLKLGTSKGFSLGSSSDDSPIPPGQWGMHRVGYTPLSDPRSAWKIEDGSRKNVVVAVIDSGLDLTHVDRPAFLWTNSGEIPDNQKDDDGNGYVDDIHGWNFIGENNDITDYYGHGTFVAGIIAAKTNNAEGIAGINPGARIMTLKAADKEGRARSLAIYRAIRYAVDNGARVINISLGAKGISHLEQVGVNYAYAQGCLVVVSAGNQTGDISEYGPPGVRRAFSVAAVNVNGKHRPSANSGFNVALTAPGEHIHSLTAQQGKKDGVIAPMVPTTYHTLSGTSFSAPFVAGTASLIWAKYPQLTNRQIEAMLLNSAEDMDRTGWDRYNGAGLLNAGKALGSPTDDRLTVRFTEVFTNKRSSKIASLDVYGVVRGDLNSYLVEVGKGKKPSKWQPVFGPSNEPADYSLICRIDGKSLKSRESTVRITAKSKSGQTRTASFVVRKW
jgi:subtilisin family serine protease